MFDTMTMTKIIGAFCGTFLVFLLGGWVAEELYHTGGHGEAHQAYVIDTGSDDDGGGGEAEPEVPFEEVFASADAAEGEKLWRQCSACHKLEDGANGTGPYLYHVVGRDIGGVADYPYSEALAAMGEAWTPENLNGFLLNPKDWAPGTKMGYKGMDDVEDRANLIAYLETIGS